MASSAANLYTSTFTSRPRFSFKTFSTTQKLIGYKDWTHTGGPKPQCYASVRGETLLDLARQSVAQNNALTTLQCSQTCSNPESLVGVDDTNGTYTIASQCGGLHYTYKPSPIYLIKSNPCDAQNGPSVADPCTIGMAATVEREIDFDPGTGDPLIVARTYNSRTVDNDPGLLGPGWRFGFELSAIKLTAPITVDQVRQLGHIQFSRETGQFIEFTYDASSQSWLPDPDEAARVQEIQNNGTLTGWMLFPDNSGNFEIYGVDGKLQQIAYKSGKDLYLTYDSNTGLLRTVTDQSGRSITLAYQNSILTSITLPDETSISYKFLGGLLSAVQYQESSGTVSRQYSYTSNGQLSSIIDENGVLTSSWTYDSSGEVTSNFRGPASQPLSKTTFTYLDNDQVQITGPLGGSSTLGYSALLGVNRITGSDKYCRDCGANFASRTYDSNGHPATQTDFNGVITAYTYDANDLETQRIEAKGTSVQRTTNTKWDTALRNPLERTVLDASGKLTAKTDWVYNVRGQVIARCEDDPTVSGATSYACSTSGTAPAGVRRWVYTYCDAVGGQCPLIGLLLSVDGPRTDVADVTHYAYYTTTNLSGCGTPGGACYHLGDLEQVRDALGHVTTTVSYDKDGRPTETKDPNGVVTTFTYTPRGWLHTRSVAGATTTIDYDAVGNVTKVIQPDGVFTSYAYDAAHRLTTISDALGNAIQFTLDAAGSRVAEKTYASGSSTPSRSLSRAYNSLGELVKELDAYGHATTYAYDRDGNRTDITDPLGVKTHESYDALSRLSQTIRNYQGTDVATANTTTTFGYDSHDNLTQVTDPNGLKTNYVYNGLDDLKQQRSPDTGTTTDVYHAVGNLVSHTDARGVTTTYAYDVLNRVTGARYPTPGLDVHYDYDQGNSTTGCAKSSPIGRLTGMADVSGSTAWCYDDRGNMIEKIQLIGTAKYITFYTYNSADRLMGVTYPDGAKVTYTRDADGRIASVAATPVGGINTAVIKATTYLPFGPVTTYSFAGNGQALNKLYDANYRATDIEGSALNLHFKLDAVGDITAEGNAAGVPTPNESYLYDPLDRLLQVDGATGAAWQRYTYNKTGDRLSKVMAGEGTDTYSYTSNTHHLIGISGYDVSKRTMDANGNTTAFQANGWNYGLGYNDANRLTAVQQNGSTIATYGLNGIGERVTKTLSGRTQSYVYDEAGKLLGEYTTGQSRDYVWADGTLVAILDNPAQGGGTIHYVYTDNLGSPRAVTTPTGTVVWDWPYNKNPFGEAAASGNGYTLNLRYPGQYFDAETGLMNNGHRDYYSSDGRYIESDPMGLFGGQASTYAYVESSPLNSTDPLGLFDSLGFLLHKPPTVPGGGLLKFCPALANPVTDAILIGMWPNSTSGCDQPYPPPQNQCHKDDDDVCFNRWQAESAKCTIWGSLGARWVRACRDRARYRFQLCVQNGGTPDPSEPPPWIPSEDYPH